jgi:hypothetical protein
VGKAANKEKVLHLSLTKRQSSETIYNRTSLDGNDVTHEGIFIKPLGLG